MGGLLQDLRYGARALLRSRGFTLVAALSLTLGIGANAVIFSLVNATLLRPLSVERPEELVYVFSGSPNSPYNNFSYPDLAELRARNRVFSGLAAYGGIAASLSLGDRAELVAGAIVTGDYFDVLGVRAARGRTFAPEEDRTPNAHPVAVISHGLWQGRFGGEPQVVGRQVTLNSRSFTVIGVLPEYFFDPLSDTARDVYVPMMMQALVRPPRGGYSGEMNPDLLGVRGNRWLWGVGRLKPGVTREQAQASLVALTEEQARSHPDTNANRAATLAPLSEGDPRARRTLLSTATLLLSIVGVVLLIACANVANLLLARSSARRKEVAVRLALGASRFRLVRQLLTESTLLAVLGGALGLFVALWAVDVLRAMPPPPGLLPLTPDFSADWRVLAFTLGLSLLTGVLFGLVPALQASRPDLIPALKDEPSAPEHAGRRFNLRSALVVAQVAMSLVLLIAAGLFVRSLWRAAAVEPGFAADRILTAQLNINLLRYTRAQGREFYRQAVERVRAVPGVESASLARNVPLGGGGSVRSLLVEGQRDSGNIARSEGGGVSAGDDPNLVNVNVIGAGYFQTTGISLLGGRDFDERDAEDRPGVVIVNESFVARHFNGQGALGQRLSFRGAEGPWYEIVGVARDSKYRALSEGPTPFVYLPLAQNHETGMTLLVRTAGDPAAVAAAVRSEVQAIDRNVPLTGVRPMTELIGNSLYAARMGATLLGVFALVALTLAAVGVYGVMAFSVARRTREIGIRMALGAGRRDVLRLVLKEGMTLVAVGVGVGLMTAAAVTRLLAGFLYGVSVTDAATFIAVPAALALVALAACYVPARRATKVDPLVALRYE
jgi:macrolide transport system ATP-binding/permease protein